MEQKTKMEYIKEGFKDNNKVIDWRMVNETLKMDTLDFISKRKVKNRKKILPDKIQEEKEQINYALVNLKRTREYR